MSKKLDYRTFRETEFEQGSGKLSGKEVNDLARAIRVQNTPSSPIEGIAFGIVRVMHRVRVEAGKLEVHFICRTPQASPGPPYASQVMQIFSTICNHVERVPVFMSTFSGWRYWVLRLSAKKTIVEPLLQGVASDCGCDPWLNAGYSAEIYQRTREWLKGRDKSA